MTRNARRFPRFLQALPWGVLVGLLTVLVLPMLMWFTGLVSGLDGKTSFMLGHIVNQISEFSLIIANIAVGMGIFTKTMYLTIVIATLITFVGSSIGHVNADAIYDKLASKVLTFLDARCRVKDEAKHAFEMSHHVVILGFNEIALEIAEYFREKEQKPVVLVHEDPELHATLCSLYQGPGSKHDTGANGSAEEAPSEHQHPARSLVGTSIYSQYADPNNSDSWHHYGLHHASLVISCQQHTTETDCILAGELLHHNVPFLTLADSNNEVCISFIGIRTLCDSVTRGCGDPSLLV
jgi:hypothetical protein